MKPTYKEFVFRSQRHANEFVTACKCLGDSKGKVFEQTCERVVTNLTLSDCRRAARFSGVSLPDYHTVDEDDREEPEPAEDEIYGLPRGFASDVELD